MSPRSTPPGNPGLFAEPTFEGIVAYCDGGSRGNPGPAGFGVYIQHSAGGVVGELSEFLGVRTNNFAEYSALLASLEFAISKGHKSLKVISDSELMVKQIKGQYRVNSPELRPLYEEARRRIAQIQQFQIQHVLREKNRHADRLANLAMDRGMGRAPMAEAAPPMKPAPTPKPAPPIPIVMPAPPAAAAAAPTARSSVAAKPAMLRGLVKGGVVHVLGADLPEGTYVKLIPE